MYVAETQTPRQQSITHLVQQSITEIQTPRPTIDTETQTPYHMGPTVVQTPHQQSTAKSWVPVPVL